MLIARLLACTSRPAPAQRTPLGAAYGLAHRGTGVACCRPSASTSLFTPAQVTSTNVDIARIAPKYHIYSVDEVQALINRL
jgi:hypothetical protein